MTGRRGDGGRWAATNAPGTVDGRLTSLVLLLLGFGLVMVYSASSVLSMIRFGSSTAFFGAQATRAAIGLVGMFVVARLDYRIWSAIAKPLVWVSIGLLVVLAVPPSDALAPEVNGARRWIALPGFSFQPLEVAKLALIVWMAATIARKGERIERFSDGVAPLVLPALAMAGLLLFQPDFKGAGFVLLLTWTMLLLGGARIRHLAGLAGAAVPVGIVVVALEPYRLRRISAWFDPGQDLGGTSYQIHQSLISLGSGGWLGIGLGSSKQKFAFLPAAHNDFIFSIVGEELGVLGTMFVLGAFLWFGWIGFRIARRAPDAFGFLLASGITALVVIAALVNIGVATAVLPTTGLTLPFISYGGTSLIVQLVAVGILMSVSRHGVEDPPGRGEEGRGVE